MNQLPSEHHYTVDEIDLLDLVKVLWRARRLIVGLTLAAVLIAFALTAFRPHMYESTATFSVRTVEMSFGTSHIRPSVETSQLTVETSQTPVYNWATLISVLHSRALAEDVVDTLQLTAEWEGTSRQEAIRRLQETISISADERDGIGIVTVKFADPDPVLARDVVATYISRFERAVQDLYASEVNRALNLARERLAGAEERLLAAETALREFKERHGIVDLTEQTVTLVEAHALLAEQVRLLTAELAGKRAYLPEDAPEVRELAARLAVMERHLAVLETDAGTDGTASEALDAALAVRPPEERTANTDEWALASGSFGLQQVPALAVELDRLQREVSTYRSQYDTLRQQ